MTVSLCIIFLYVEVYTNAAVIIWLHMQMWWNHLPHTVKKMHACIAYPLTHWGRMTHICVSKLTIIGLDNGLLPDRHQAIIWTIAEILLIGPLGTNLSEILIEIRTFSFKIMYLEMSSGKWRPSGLGLNELNQWCIIRGMHSVPKLPFLISPKFSTVATHHDDFDFSLFVLMYEKYPRCICFPLQGLYAKHTFFSGRSCPQSYSQISDTRFAKRRIAP